MSYCRFSSDNFGCDVYAYSSGEDRFHVHLAFSRVVGDVPKLPDLPDPGPGQALPQEAVQAYMEAHRAQMDFLETAEREPLDLPHAGGGFVYETLEEVLEGMLWLRSLGYRIPDYAFERIEEEMREEETR
jgi:hypothetical protein